MTSPEFYTLPNGLRVVMQRLDFTPVVSVAMWVQVGSADESPREAGLAHLHEHMIFKGTPRRPVGQIAAEVEGAGGDINAFTSYDHTCYYLTLGKDEFALGLDILADAIFSASFNASELRKETKVVLEELALYRDLPGAHLAERCWDKVFKLHPYGRPIIGDKQVLENLKRSDVLRFYRKHYRPGRMVLSLAGDFDSAEAKRLIKKLFAAQPKANSRRAPRPVEPAQSRFRSLVLNDPIGEAHLYLAWHGPSYDGELSAELDLLSMILGSGESSRLEHRVKTMQRLVYDVSSHMFAPAEPGVFAVDAVTQPDLAEAAVESLLREVFRLRVQLVGPRELARAKQNVEAAFIGRHETAAGIGQALGYSVALTGDVHLERDYLARIRNASREGLRAAANRYLRIPNLTAAVLLPKQVKMTSRQLTQVAKQADEEFPCRDVQAGVTRVAKEKPISVSGYAGRRGRLKKISLSNGIRLIVRESAHAPLTAIRTCMLGGLRYEALKQNGVSYLTSMMLSRGTAARSALQFAKQVEDMAGSVRGISGYNSIGVAAEFLSADFEQGLDLVAEAMLEPAFRPLDIRRAKQVMLGNIRQREDNLPALVRDLFAATLYGDHPYGRKVLGDERTLKGLGAQAVREFWQSLLDPTNLVIAVSGDVDFSRVVENVEKTFGKMKSAGFAPAQLDDPEPPQGIVLAQRQKPKEQAHILAGFLGCRIGSKDEYTLQLLNAVLSGQGGRLFAELRDKMHLAYNVYSFHREGMERGSFGFYIATGNQTAELALAALREQIGKIIEHPPRGEELERAKRYLIGSSRLDLQTNGSLALTMGLNELIGAGYRAHLRFAEKVRRVNERQIADVVRRYLSVDDIIIAMIHG